MDGRASLGAVAVSLLRGMCASGSGEKGAWMNRGRARCMCWMYSTMVYEWYARYTIA